MGNDLSEQFQFRVTKDGKLHICREGEKWSPEARLDICQRCREERGVIQRIERQKTEFAGKKGKVRRVYVCPVHAPTGRTIPRQKREVTRGILKEPEKGK